MSTGGGLLDLVSRGKKDTFFTNNPKISHIHSVYKRCAAFTQEIRYTQPRNNPEWGNWTEFEIEPVGDIMRNPTLLIELPTWLPSSQAQQNLTSITTDNDGVQYGYCKHIGILMIDKIQVFMDQILIHEFWGIMLYLRAAMSKNAAIYSALANRTNLQNICHAATPPRLHIPIPLVGNQAPNDLGFPLIAFGRSRFRIRVFLKKLEEVIEASDMRLNPNPWGKPFVQTTQNGKTNFTTLQKYQMAPLTITLETTQIYLPRDAQELLKTAKIPLLFTQTQLSKFTIETNKWPQDQNTTVALPCPLDFTGAVSRLTVFGQSEGALLSGQQYNTTDYSGGEFLNSIRLNSGLRDRLDQFPSHVWRDIANYYKNENQPHTKTAALQVYTLTFGQEPMYVPAGTFNMSRVNNNAVLYVGLNPIIPDPRTSAKRTYLYVFAEMWNILEIKDGRAVVLFAD